MRLGEPDREIFVVRRAAIADGSVDRWLAARF
jgi:hypothetical protein